MPELPEVESLCRMLAAELVGREIRSVHITLPRLVRGISLTEFAAQLAGKRFTSVRRRGKFLLFGLSPWVLASHLRMEGRYALRLAETPCEPHVHAVFQLDNGYDLRYQDVRKFGTFDLLPEQELERVAPLATLGLEPLQPWTWQQLQAMAQNRRGSLKGFLLDQRNIVGLGNIYVDETLFAARLHPLRRAGSLSELELKRLHRVIPEVLKRALQAGGTTIRSYRRSDDTQGSYQSYLVAYGRAGQPCVSCGAMLQRLVVLGRGTHCCPQCQPAPESLAGG